MPRRKTRPDHRVRAGKSQAGVAEGAAYRRKACRSA